MRALLAAINCQKGDIDLNFETHRTVVKQAIAERCDIAVFPEMSLTGYLDPRRADHTPISLSSGPVRQMCELSKESGITLLFGISEANGDNLPLISQIHVSDGQIDAVYRKRHLGEGEPGLYVPGDRSVTGTVNGENFGIAVCADRDWPDEFKFAASSNARIVFHPSAPGLWGRRTDEASWRQGFNWWRDTCIEIHGRYAKQFGISIAVVTQAGSTDDEEFPGWAALIGEDGEIKSELPDWTAGTLVVDV